MQCKKFNSSYFLVRIRVTGAPVIGPIRDGGRGDAQTDTHTKKPIFGNIFFQFDADDDVVDDDNVVDDDDVDGDDDSGDKQREWKLEQKPQTEADSWKHIFLV